MEPLPGTTEALEALGALARTGLLSQLTTMGREVGAVVPECLGLSLTLVAERLTFTLVAPPPGAADPGTGDAGGTTAAGGRAAAPTRDVLDERAWQQDAHVVGSQVRSSLSLPVIRGGHLVAGVIVYATSPGAFDGRHREVAGAVGAWAPGAVENADLSFASRWEAAAAPGRLRERVLAARAVRRSARRRDVTVDVAVDLLAEAARRAGISETQLARVLRGVLER